MRTAEKAGRIFFTLIGILGVMLLLLPQIGISVDSIMSGSMEPVLRTGGIVFTDTKERRPEIGDIVTSSPANYGFQNSVDDCGNWPFIYSFKLDAENGGFGTTFETNSLLEDPKPIGDVLIFSNENETIAYLHDREVEYLAPPVTP